MGKAGSSSWGRNAGSSVADGATVLARHAPGAAGVVVSHLDEGMSRATSQVREVAERAVGQVDLTAHHLAETLPGVLAEAGQRAAKSLTGALAP